MMAISPKAANGRATGLHRQESAERRRTFGFGRATTCAAIRTAWDRSGIADVSAAVQELTHGAMKTIFVIRIKIAAALIVAAFGLAAAAALATEATGIGARGLPIKSECALRDAIAARSPMRAAASRRPGKA